MAKYNFTEAQSKPGLTVEGAKWYQNCYVCNKQIDFLKVSKESWLSVDPYVRHKKCDPPSMI